MEMAENNLPEEMKRKAGRPRKEEIVLASEKDVESITAGDVTPVATNRVIEDSGIKFFGECDMDEKGKIVSATPAWTREQTTAKKKEEKAMLEGNISSGLIPQQNLQSTRERVAQLDSEISMIENSRPNLNTKQTDMVFNNLKELGQELKQAMPSRTNIQRNLVSSQNEYNMKTKPCIELKNEDMVRMARNNNIAVTGNKITRDSANLLYGMMAKSIGAEPNVEYLRRD